MKHPEVIKGLSFTWSVRFLEKILMSPDPALYFFINQGSIVVDNMDDKEEMKTTDVSCPARRQSVFRNIISSYMIETRPSFSCSIFCRSHLSIPCVGSGMKGQRGGGH